jgi:hypothetical protein
VVSTVCVIAGPSGEGFRYYAPSNADWIELQPEIKIGIRVPQTRRKEGEEVAERGGQLGNLAKSVWDLFEACP